MNIKELIDRLKKYPENARIIITQNVIVSGSPVDEDQDIIDIVTYPSSQFGPINIVELVTK